MSFSAYAIENLPSFVQNMQRITTNELRAFVQGYHLQNNLRCDPNMSAVAIGKFFRREFQSLCLENGIDFSNVMKTVIWSNHGQTYSGKSFDFTPFGENLSRETSVFAIADVSGYRAQANFREKLKTELLEMFDTSEIEFNRIICLAT